MKKSVCLMNHPASHPSIRFWVALMVLGMVIGCSHSQSADQPDIGSAAAERTATPPLGVENVLTYHNDNARTGQYLKETVLAPWT